MGFVISDAERDQGVVYIDAGRRDLASTHALVIGVGQYDSCELSPLKSSPASARMIADWFLDGMDEAKPDGFNNPDKPLGSLSVLLSEEPRPTLSRFASSDVPRATFDNVKKSVEAWIERASSHRDNFLFLFISGHGESFGRRTAFLLEDYGTKKTDITAGMSEIEQFVEALANVDAEQQLLIFDCCRTKTPLNLRFEQEFGSRLINLPAATDGRMRRAHVLRSTGLGFEAWGRKEGPTIFAQVLLDALRGLAASSNGDWTLDNFELAHTIGRILNLHTRGGTPIQMSDNQLNALFMISTVLPIETTTVFVSLAPPHDFSTCKISVDGQPIETSTTGASQITPFARLVLPKGQAGKIAAYDAAGVLIGETHIKPVPPVQYRVLPERIQVRSAASKGMELRGPANRRFATSAVDGEITVSVDATAAVPPNGLIVIMRPRDKRTTAPIIASLPNLGTKKIVGIKPGLYDVSIDIFDGYPLFSTVEIRGGVTTEVTLQLPTAELQPGLQTPSAELPAGDPAVPVHDVASQDAASKADAKNWLRRLGIDEQHIRSGEWAGRDIYAATISPARFRDLVGLEFLPAQQALDVKLVIVRFEKPPILAIKDRIAYRLPQRLQPPSGQPEQADLPVWVATAGRDWREIAVIPSIGVRGEYQKDASGQRDIWAPSLRVTPDPHESISHTCAMVNTHQWGGLLALLGQRDFELAGIVLDDLLGWDKGNWSGRNAQLQKIENPITAIATALIAVASRRLGQLKIPDGWLRDLTKWFPQLPDAPIILARHLISQKGAETVEVKALLIEACHRGVPVFSLSVDWLAEGLAPFADDPRYAVAARTTRRIAQLCDPTRVFTVLRIPVEEDETP